MPSIQRRRLRAPQDDGTALIDPPLSDVKQLIAENQKRLTQFDRLASFPTGFRASARQRAVMSAAARLNDKPVFEGNASGPLVLSGHQPELFHPGVWLKNFVLSETARHIDGAGINVVIDNDVARSTTIRVPSGSVHSPELTSVPFDTHTEEIPWERRLIADFEVFRNFPTEVRRVFAPLLNKADYGSCLLLDRFWPYAIQELEYDLEFCRSMGYATPMVALAGCLSAGRLHLEREIGLRLNDCRLSLLTSGKDFAAFASYMLSRHQELHEIHNAALAEYRHINGVRSHTHPVPDLTRDGDWYEMPFWLITQDTPARRRVFARRANDGWQITDRQGLILKSPIEDWPTIGPSWQSKAANLRPRALITTMYSRLVLSDLFIHGIGGAKYDELTDLIIRRFFGIEPPAYLTATATFRLPIDHPNVSLDDVRHSAQRLRDLRYRPESFVRDERVKNDSDLSQRIAALAAEKRDYLASHDLRRCAPDVFNRLDAINRAMHDLLRDVEAESRAHHAELIALARQSTLLGSREFSFVLFPSEKLPARLLELSTGIA